MQLHEFRHKHASVKLSLVRFSGSHGLEECLLLCTVLSYVHLEPQETTSLLFLHCCGLVHPLKNFAQEDHSVQVHSHLAPLASHKDFHFCLWWGNPGLFLSNDELFHLFLSGFYLIWFLETVAQADPKHNPPSFGSWALGLQFCTTKTSSICSSQIM